ncbi:MAG: VWA domain-containing protein [Acidobacteriota bacterium]
MELARPEWMWFLLLAPAVGGLAALAWRRRLRAIAVWSSRGLWGRLVPGFDVARLRFSVVALVAAALFTVLALTQPRWGQSEQHIERQGIDIVFVLDTSLSMATQDLQPSRLWVAQTLIRQLAQRLPGHRVALVQAEGDGVVMAPLTADAAILDLLLDAVQPGSLPTPGTELAPALRRAAELFGEGEGTHRAMVVFSDGEDHGKGTQEIADELSEAGILVHTVGVGTLEGMPFFPAPLPEETEQEYHRDEGGNVVVSRLIEANLELLARATGGVYLRATSAGTSVEPLFDAIESMERRGYGAETIERLEERFQWPLGLAILALALHLGRSPFSGREGL